MQQQLHQSRSKNPPKSKSSGIQGESPTAYNKIRLAVVVLVVAALNLPKLD